MRKQHSIMIDELIWKRLQHFAFDNEISTSDIIEHLAKKFIIFIDEERSKTTEKLSYKELVNKLFERKLQ